MTDWEKARDEAAEDCMRETFGRGIDLEDCADEVMFFDMGADWARRYMLEQDAVVRGLVEALVWHDCTGNVGRCEKCEALAALEKEKNESRRV